MKIPNNHMKTRNITKNPRILVVQTPQAEVWGKEGRHTPKRERCPNPAGPMVAGLMKKAFSENGVQSNVALIDARSEKFGDVEKHVYGKFRPPYVEGELTKEYEGIDLRKIVEPVQDADIVCFTSHFTGSSAVVKEYIKQVKTINPDAEVWVGGNDVSTAARQESYRKVGADLFWVGDVFNTFPKYVMERWGNDASGSCRIELDSRKRGRYVLPIPSYDEDLEYLSKNSDCAEGPYPGKDEDYRPAVYTEFNKGCFHNCPFCTLPMTRKFFASMPLEEVKKHLDYYKSLGVKTLIMMDDNLLGPINFWGNQKAGLDYVNGLLNLINSYGFNVEFGNGLQLSTLINYWDEIKESLFRNCFRFYMPVEDLASGPKRFAKLPRYEQELDLFGKIADGIGSLQQITIGIIIGGPEDDEEGVEKTLERMEEIKSVFRGSHIEIAFTPFMNKLLPNTKNFNEHYNDLTIYDIDEHPELYFFSLVSNVTKFIKDPKVIWEAWKRMMHKNPAQDYLENFREAGEVTLKKVV